MRSAVDKPLLPLEPAPMGDGSRRSGALAARGLTGLRESGILLPFIALFIVLSVASSHFFTGTNLLNVGDQQASTLIAAAGETLVLVTGGLDLSIGAIYVLAGVTAAHFALVTNPAFAILLALLVGLAIGVTNGVVVAVLRVNSLIATLAASYVVIGIAGLATGGNIIDDFSRPSFGDFSRTLFIGVHTSTWVTIFVLVLLGVMLHRTTTGRYMYAAGGNPEAAQLAGVRVRQVQIFAFACSGVAAALGGVIDTSRVLSSPSVSNEGFGLAFAVLAGVVVGGTSILGGRGAMWRSVVGILFIALIGNGFNLLGANPLYETIVLGVLLVAAVAFDAWTRLRQG
ncbi:MAG: ABC transporter permease [Acidimicrobiales bacterium]